LDHCHSHYCNHRKEAYFETIWDTSKQNFGDRMEGLPVLLHDYRGSYLGRNNVLPQITFLAEFLSISIIALLAIPGTAYSFFWGGGQAFHRDLKVSYRRTFICTYGDSDTQQ